MCDSLTVDDEAELAKRRAEYLANLTPEQRKKRELATAKRMVASKGGMLPRGKGFRSEQKAASKAKGFGSTGPKPSGGLKYDRRPKAAAQCACGSGLAYGKCCSPSHEAMGCDAADPSALVRARYTAFRYRLPDFLMATCDPCGDEYQTDHGEWKKSLLHFCDQMDFRKLTVESVDGAASPPTVEFRASFVQKGTLNLMDVIEKSEFVHSEGKWLYTRGTVEYAAPKD